MYRQFGNFESKELIEDEDESPGLNGAKISKIWGSLSPRRGCRILAQGFNPGNDTHKEIALKGRPNGIDYNVYICCCMQWLSHHRKFSYQEELRELLKRHLVAFDERYLWE